MNMPIAFAYQQPKVLLGSCFSEEIGSLLQQNGFDCLVNPGGTLFHPLALANLLHWALDEPAPLRILQRDDIFLSWDLSGTFYALSAQDFDQKVKALHHNLRHYLQHASHLLLTFGTAWVYALKSDGRIVANCHKQPATEFAKKLTDLNDLQHSWEQLLDKLKAFNPRLELIFTVSPVRHLKDGLIENTRSKARLHLLVEALCEVPNCHYFEAYEIVLDQLRDYAYFKDDTVHPNQKAIGVVWAQFQEKYLDPSTIQILDEWRTLQKSKAHKLLYPESKEAKRLKEEMTKRTAEFFRKYPDFLDTTPA
jgi:hypothetical protein